MNRCSFSDNEEGTYYEKGERTSSCDMSCEGMLKLFTVKRCLCYQQ